MFFSDGTGDVFSDGTGDVFSDGTGEVFSDETAWGFMQNVCSKLCMLTAYCFSNYLLIVAY